MPDRFVNSAVTLFVLAIGLAGCAKEQSFPVAGAPGSIRNLPKGTGAAKYYDAAQAAGHSGARPPGGWRPGQ
jgi:hypothetical protein